MLRQVDLDALLGDPKPLIGFSAVSHTGIAERRDVSRPTVIRPPKRLGVRHSSSRLLAAKLKIDHATVARAWKDYGCSRGGHPINRRRTGR